MSRPTDDNIATAVMHPLGKMSAPLVTHDRFPGYIAELFRSLRAKVLFGMRDVSRRALGVTSLESGAGKTTISLNLALSLAQRRVRTLVIDGDLRRGGLSRLLDAQQKPGLAEFLESGLDITEQNVLTLPHREPGGMFAVLPAGRCVAYSSELLGDGRFAAVMELLCARYEMVVVDLPPVGMAVDPVVVQETLSRFLIVAQADATNIADLDRKLREHEQLRAKSLGIILNRAAIDRNLRYYKYSKYYSDNTK